MGVISDAIDALEDWCKDLFKDGNAVRDSYTCKACAVAESIPANASNAVWNSYACKACAVVESITVNTRNAIWNSYACKACAILKSMIANTRNAVWNSYVCKACAVESIAANACNRFAINCFRNNHISV